MYSYFNCYTTLKHFTQLNYHVFLDFLLKAMIPEFITSCSMMIEQWKMLASLNETCEVDVWPELQNLTRDVISWAALGSSFEESRNIFEFQKEHITLTLEAMQTLYIPGFR